MICLTKTVGILLVISSCVIAAYARHIYGTVVEANTPVANMKVEIVTPSNAYSTTTAGDGSYRLFVPENGKCTFKAHYKGQTPAVEIYSYDDPVGYKFEIVVANGTYQLVKR